MDGLTGTKGAPGVWQRIISEMPPHEVYIEPFWGRGTIAKRKRPARYTIGVDLDPAAIESGAGSALMFRADGIQWLADYFRLPLSEDWAASAEDAQSHGGRPTHSSAAAPGGSGQAARVASSRGVVSGPSPDAGLSDADRDAELRDSAAGSGNCTFGGAAWERHFVYLDPPYLGCTGHYRHELTEAQHRVLCRLFLRLPCPAALSGYRSDVYAAELSGCRSTQIPTVNRAGKRVNEIVWLNYDEPHRYHDVRFIGDGRRERERIRRRVKAWSNGLRRMKPAERQAVFESCVSAVEA